MRKRYLFLLSLLFPFATMMSSGGAYAQTDAEYEAALAAINDGGSYFITTTVNVDGVETKFYLTHSGTLAEWEDEDTADSFTLTKVSGGAFKTYGFYVHGSSYFSNPNASDNIDDTSLHTNDSGRADWEAQVFFLGENGKYAVRATNAGGASSGWGWVGSSFWTVKYDEDNYPYIGYSFDVNYEWDLELPSELSQMMTIVEGLVGGDGSYTNYAFDDREEPFEFNMGTGFGQLSDWNSWYAFWDLLQEVVDALYAIEDGDESKYPTLEQAQAWKATLDELYQKILDSEVPYTVADGYYRIVAHNRYKSEKSIDGFVDMVMAASYSAEHENKVVYSPRDNAKANFVWKLTKSESGDSILLQNVGMETYISTETDSRVLMTEDPADALYVVFDYADPETGPSYVEPYGIGEDKDIFSIRLARTPRSDNNYFHQNNHSSVNDDSSPWGNYGKDTGEEQEVTFWIRTWNAGRTTDLWTSEWFLEPVDEGTVSRLVNDFAIIKDHDKLVEQNNELREKVAETLSLAKDVIRTKMITSVNQLSSPHSDPSEGTNIGALIDGDAGTFWHTTWHGYAEGTEGMWYYGEGYEDGRECHYLQISGMDNMVGDCELYLRERDGADNDRVAKIVLMGTDNLKNEDEDWEEMAVITLPHTGKGEENTVPFHVEEAYPYVRVLVVETAFSSYAFRSFWHAAEIQFYTVADNPNSQFVQMGEVAQTLQDTYDANCATPDNQITPEIYQALLDAYNAFLAYGLIDPAELRAAIEKYAKATEGVKEGTNPGYWADMTVPNAYDALYEEVKAYDKAGKYNLAEIHRYIVMLKAMQKSVMETANGVKTDKWYRIMYPTEEMFDAYDWNKDGGDNCNELYPEDQKTMWGTFVSAGKLESEEVPDLDENGDQKYDDEGNEVMKTNTWLEAIGGEDLREGNRLFFVNDEAIEDKDASMFRFVELESDAADYTPLFADVKENMQLALDMSTSYTRGEALITNVSQLSSNASDEAEGKDLGALIDGNTGTFWHSDWHVKVIAPPYLQVALNEPVSGLIQVEITRRNNGFGHIVRMYIQGSNDGETWTNVGYLEAPYDGNPSSVVSCQPVDLDGTYSYLRFINTCRWLNGGGNSTEMDPFAEPQSSDEYDVTWTYFHAAEFQIYPVTADTELSASAKAVQDAYKVANKVVLKDATAEDLAAASQAYKAFQSEFNAKEGKTVLPNGLSKAPATYALQNKATGLYVMVSGTGNQNNIYLKTVPTLVGYKAIGYQRSLLSAWNVAGTSCNNLHAGESNRRFCTWGTTDPTTNSGLVICEADEEYAAPEAFTFFRDVKPGAISAWCNSVNLTPEEALDAAAYTPLGQYTKEEDGAEETYLALKAIESLPAGEPVFFIYGDTTSYAYDPEVEINDEEPFKFTLSGAEKPVLEAKAVNGVVGSLVNHTLNPYDIYFTRNYAKCIGTTGYYLSGPCVYFNIDICPKVDPDEDYDFSILVSEAVADCADGVKDISSAIEKISQPGNVYSMDGKLLRTGATLNSLKALGAGTYILNGVKVIVK